MPNTTAPAHLSPDDRIAADSNNDTGQTVCLVGDQFSGMATVPGVHTLSQLTGDLRRGTPVPSNIILGQGLQEYELEYLRTTLSGREHNPHDILVRPSDAPRVARSLVHKHREQNVLLADLRKTADQRFQADLVLHGDNELLLDHQTGQHVQGMVVAEALRQMFMAVFEIEHGVRHPDRTFYVVWNSMSLTFDSFLFPLPAEITCEILRQDITDPAKMAFTVAMSIEQLGTTSAHTEIEFTAFDDAKIKRSEMRKATSTVEALMNRHAPTGKNW